MLIALFLMFAIVTSLILPIVKAQNYANPIMNLPGTEGEIPNIYCLPHAVVDIDLNGPTSDIGNVTLWVMYPGRTVWTYIGGWPTSGGDLDVYSFDFNETGDFALRWRIPPQDGVPANPSDPDGYWNSNIEIARVTYNLPADYWRSFIYIGASPNPVGVGQEAVIVIWTADMPPDIGEQSGAASSPTGRAGWADMYVQVVKPDGTNETLNFPFSDAVGANWISWTPTEVGTYTLQAFFPGAWKNSSSSARFYEPDTSAPMELTVQDEQIQAWQEPPLPNTYWTRPLNTANRFWSPIASQWLGGTSDQLPMGGYGGTTDNFVYGFGCETPHILWTRQYAVGGLMAQRYGETGYQTAHYQGLSFSGLILNGIIHYTPRITHASAQGWEQVDLYTGEELFLDWDVTRPSMGQVYDYASGNQHGGFAYLWRTSGVTLPDQVQVAHAVLEEAGKLPLRISGATTVNSSTIRTGTLWEMIDAWTGKTICYVANVTSGGTAVYSKDGSMLRYNIVDLQPGPGVNYYLQVWNSSAGTMVISQTGTGAWQWRPAGGGFGGADPYWGSTSYNNVHDGNLMYSTNVSLPLTSAMGTSIRAVREGEYIIGGTTGSNDESGVTQGVMWKISLETGSKGTLLWNREFTPPSSADREAVSLTGVYPESGVFLFHSQRTIKRFGYDLETMQQIWETEPETQFHYYGRSQNVYDGVLYSYGYGGVITAYNITTGEILWEYAATSEGFESTYGGNYPIGIVLIASGKLYTVTGEHSPTQPLYRGHNLRCLNATTGDEIWKILGWFGGMSPTSSMIMMADGILVGLNFFDNQIYAFGRGRSGTTVTALPKVSMHGTKVMVEGTVTDQTATGRRDINNVVDFTLKGTPAISDEDQAAWMEYMFMQQAKPADAKGVEVVLSVLDPNNNVYEIGRTTSDVEGNFGFEFDPLVPGVYQITATFEGSNAYGPSAGTTYLTVEEAPAATAEPTPIPASAADLYFLPVSIGTIVAIIVVGLLLFLLLRKR